MRPNEGTNERTITTTRKADFVDDDAAWHRLETLQNINRPHSQFYKTDARDVSKTEQETMLSIGNVRGLNDLGSLYPAVAAAVAPVCGVM